MSHCRNVTRGGLDSKPRLLLAEWVPLLTAAQVLFRLRYPLSDLMSRYSPHLHITRTSHQSRHDTTWLGHVTFIIESDFTRPNLEIIFKDEGLLLCTYLCRIFPAFHLFTYLTFDHEDCI